MNLLNRLAGGALLMILALAGCSDEPTSSNNNNNNNNQSNLRVLDSRKLSAQASTVSDHLYDVDTDSSYRINFYSTQKARIELIYFYSSADKWVLASPDLDELTGVANFGGYITSSNMTGAHETRLKKLTNFTAAQFDALNDSTQLRTAVEAGGAGAPKVTNLAENDIISFNTSGGKIGLLKVVSFWGSSAASELTFTVKMQK